jgi:hypothetical protein
MEAGVRGSVRDNSGTIVGDHYFALHGATLTGQVVGDDA